MNYFGKMLLLCNSEISKEAKRKSNDAEVVFLVFMPWTVCRNQSSLSLTWLFSIPLSMCLCFALASFTLSRCPAILRHSLSTLSRAAVLGIDISLWILMKLQRLRSTSLRGSHLFSVQTKHARICCVSCVRRRRITWLAMSCLSVLLLQ